MAAMLEWTWESVGAGEIGPGMFSWFHILSLALMVVFTVTVCLIWGRKHREKTDRVVVGVFAGILVLCEVFKQLFWWEYYGYYRWEIFPFQFCSVPIYVSVIATILPWEKAREVCYRFLAFFGIIGGIAVMAVPSAVLYTYFVAMSIHSMVWHSVLIAMGAYLIVSRGYGRKLKELLAPFVMFLGFVVMAIIGNELVYKLVLSSAESIEQGDNLSMFYISRHYTTQLPVLNLVQEISYPLFVLTYIAFFTSLTLLVWGMSRLCRGRKVKAAV